MSGDRENMGNIREITRRIGSEQLLQLMFLVAAVYAFWEAYGFSFGGRVFPQLSASVVIVGVILLIFKDYLPTAAQQFIEGSVDLGGGYESELETELQQDDRSSEDPARFEKPLNPVVFTALMVVLYVVVGYAVGFLWITPVFVAVYLLWFEKSWLHIILVALLGFAVVYTFLNVFNIRLQEGQIFTLYLLDIISVVEPLLVGGSSVTGGLL